MIGADLKRWAERIEEDVRAGASLVELVMFAVDDLAGAFDLCPECVERPVRPHTAAGAQGMCGVCWMRRLIEGHHERLTALELRRESNMLKKQVQRVRDELEPERVRHTGPRKREDYGRESVIPTDIPIGAVIHTCESCGFTWPALREVEGVCPRCRDLREYREAERA